MSSFNTKFMKLVLAEVEAAFLKVATPDASVVLPEFETQELARDHFLGLFRTELNTRFSPEKPKEKKTKAQKSAAEIPLPASPVATSPEKEKKKRGPMTDEAKAVMKAKREATKAAKSGSPSSAKSESPKLEAPKPESPKPEAKAPKAKKAKSPKLEAPKSESPVVEAKTPKVKKTKSPKSETPKAETPKAESPKTEGEKKKRAPMTEEAKAAMKAKREATKSAKAGSPKPVEEPNLKKVDPTWKKHLKTVAKAQGKEVTKELEDELLSYLNRLTKEEFAGKKAEDHVSEFLAPSGASNAAAVAEEKHAPVDLDIVEFNGRDYFVNPETKRVYEGEGKYDDDTGAWTSYKPVGYVGMAAFTDMKLE